MLFAGLMKDRIGRIELGLRGLHARLRCQYLQISAAHRESDQIASILQAVLAGAGSGSRGTVTIEGGEVGDGLAEAGLQGEVVVRIHDRGNMKSETDY